MRKLLAVVSLLSAAACSGPHPCKSSVECSGINKCINGSCQDPSGCVPESSAEYCSRLQKNCGPVSGEDNCGASRIDGCGTCQAPQMCVDGTCAQCMAESDAALCTQLGLDCSNTSATDRCGALRGLDCGMCPSSKQCGGSGTPNLCGGCAPETDAEFCAAQSKNCGALNGTDRCGNARTASCGTCTSGTCGGAGMDNVCGCVPESDMSFCIRVGKNCGTVTAADNCGASRTASCGSCSGTATCGGTGLPANICTGCTTESSLQFCARQGKNCGSVTADDNCGIPHTEQCGTCSSTRTCGGGGTPGVCGCTPESDTAFCGRLQATCGMQTGVDNCGVQRTRVCGTCGAPQSCGGGGAQNVCGCMSESTAAFCTRLGRNCDLVTAFDNCGVQRTDNCGSCTAPKSCGGGGTPNVCGCQSESDAQLCTRNNVTCGTPTLTDLCGTSRTPTCGPSCGTGGGGGGSGGGAGGGAGGGGGGSGCSSAQTFTTTFQPLNSTVRGTLPDWEFRCAGQVADGGRGCSGGTQTPAVELRYQHTQLFNLDDRPLAGPWTFSPADGGFKVNVEVGSGGKLFCEAMGYAYAPSQASSNTFPPQGNWAVIQVNPQVWATALNGGGFDYQEPVLDIQCACAP